MVDLDLRKLSAPIEALRPELQEAYRRLDARWGEIANCLKDLPIPSSVSCTYYDDDYGNYSCLVWQKWNGKKRICLEYNSFRPEYGDHEVTTVPYEEWSGELRIEMLEHVPKLFAAAEKETRKFIEKTKN